MKKYSNFITGLTTKVGVSQTLQSSLRNGTKNLFVIGAVDKSGLITGLGSKPLMWPLNLGLNPTNFLKETICL